MILVRDVFQVKSGKAREAKELWKEEAKLEAARGGTPSRAMVDLTGEFYTFVTEATYDSVAEFEKALKGDASRSEFRTWHQKFVPLVESGRREIYTVVE